MGRSKKKINAISQKVNSYQKRLNQAKKSLYHMATEEIPFPDIVAKTGDDELATAVDESRSEPTQGASTVGAPSDQSKDEISDPSESNEDQENKELLHMLEQEIQLKPTKKKEEKGQGSSNETKINVFQLYWTLSGKLELGLIFLATLGSLGAGISIPLYSILLGTTLSGYGSQQNISPGREALFETRDEIVRQYLISGVAMFCSFFLMNCLWNFVGNRQLHKLKEMYFEAILKQDQGFFDENNAFEFSTKVQGQIKMIQTGLGEKFGVLLMLLSQIIVGLIIAFITCWTLTLVMLSAAPIMIISILWATSSMKQGIIRARKAYEQAGGIAEEVLYHIKTVSSFANYEFEKDRFNEKILESEKIGISTALKTALGNAFLYFFKYFIHCIALIYGRIVILEHHWNYSQNRAFQGGDVMTVIYTTIFAASSMGNLVPCIKAIEEACSASTDFFNLLRRKPKIDDSLPEKVISRDEILGQLEMKNVSFSYPTNPDNKILKNLNITFPAGKKIALVGESGCGKSTMVTLIERLYEPTEGDIFIDGHNIKEFNLRFLRSIIGYVQQEPVLFNKSIKDNVLFGRDVSYLGDENQLVREACDSSCASSFINRIKESYDYIVGIKGSKLSGGEKQRIAIARAILERPKILILDEATSALDNKSENEVQLALDIIMTERKDLTTIIIAHRLSTIMNADIIYAIKEGNILEAGTHDELWEKNGYYAHLVRSQMVITSTNIEEEVQDQMDLLLCPKLSSMNVDEKSKLLLLKENSLARRRSSMVRRTSTFLVEEELPVEVKPEIVPVQRLRLFEFLKENTCDMFFASLGCALLGASSPINGLVLSSCVNCLSSNDEKVIRDDGLFYALMFFLVSVVMGISIYFQNSGFSKIGEILAYKLRKAVFSHYMKLHLSFYDENNHSPGALLTKLSYDTTQLNGLVLTVIGVSVQTTVTVVLGLTLGFIFDWKLGLISLFFYPLQIIQYYLNLKFQKGAASFDEKLEIEAGSFLSECVINTKTILAFNFQHKAIEMYQDILKPSKKKIENRSIVIGLLMGIGQFSTFAAYATLFYASAHFIANGDLTFDNMTRCIMCLFMSAAGISGALQFAGDYAKASNAFSSLFSTLQTPTLMDTSVEYNGKFKSAAGMEGKIEFRNVSFCYPTRPKNRVLKNLSFTIEPGQSVAFVGFSGCGKSTIIQLIERFYDLKEGEGEILIDGVNIKEYDLLSLRKKIGLVAQEPVVFKRSVKDNILYGNLNASIPQIVEAAQKGKLQKLFKKKLVKEGKEMQLSKDSSVSGGEKQRLAIARAFLKNPKILLMDEATSALDQDTERKIQKEILQLKGGRTSITIAHRLSTIQNSDCIYVLEAGRIIESGTHHQLYEKRGKYHLLYTYSTQH